MANAKQNILIVDEHGSIHAQLRAILAVPCDPSPEDSAFHLGEPPVTAAPHFECEWVATIDEGLERIRQARREGRPYELLFANFGPATRYGTLQELLGCDTELQIVLCGLHDEDQMAKLLGDPDVSGNVVVHRPPFDVIETRLLAASLAEKWRLTHDANHRLQRQSEQIADARRVMTIIEGCLDELEIAHDELRGHAVELTQRLQQREVEVIGTRDLTMFALAQLADSRDPETGEHLLRMRAYAQALAEYLATHGPYQNRITKQFLADFHRSTPLHDIGKVGIPDQILLKPGKLTKEEFEIMKRHTIIGAEALEKAACQSSFGDFLTMAAQIARSHHEKFNGRGYPDGLKGEQIPLCARITAVADVFDALTSARVYKEAMPTAEAKRLIEDECGEHFDPAMIDAFRACFDEFLEIKSIIDGGGTIRQTPLVAFDQALPLFDGGLALLPSNA